jgi:hypothetical protein
LAYAQPSSWIRKQSTLEEAEEPRPHTREGTMAVSELTEEFGLIEAGIKLFEDTDSNSIKTLKINIHIKSHI